MRVLREITATSEQLKLIKNHHPGYVIVRGAAGSGKTTTALLRLKFLTSFWLSRRDRLGLAGPVRVLVLTYNKTLRGYITELAKSQVAGSAALQITISTFGQWAYNRVPMIRLPQDDATTRTPIVAAGRKADIDLDDAFLVDEIDYLMGRFEPKDLDSYLEARRDLRGRAPRVDRALRRRLLDEVVKPYQDWKSERGLSDWNDLACQVIGQPPSTSLDIVVIDEAQDFSANQVRAVLRHVAGAHSVTFVIDAAQSIYPRHFNWAEVGVSLTGSEVHTLQTNHRNTRQIAAFAMPLVDGLDLTADAAIPDFSSCATDGPPPQVVTGQFDAQMDFVCDWLASIDLDNESVALLHTMGGGWFNHAKKRLDQAGFEWVEITRKSEWPAGRTNIALCSMPSAKGLEFDNVAIIGLNEQVTPHGPEEGDANLDNMRRLVAMGIGRARSRLLVTFKPSEASTITKYFADGSYEAVAV